METNLSLSESITFCVVQLCIIFWILILYAPLHNNRIRKQSAKSYASDVYWRILWRIHVLPNFYFQSKPPPPSTAPHHHSPFFFPLLPSLLLIILLFHLNFHLHFDYCLYLLWFVFVTVFMNKSALILMSTLYANLNGVCVRVLAIKDTH